MDKMRKYSHRKILVDAETGKFQTNGEVLERALKLAAVLKDRGINCGDRISIATENHPDWIVPVCATMFLGAILVPLNPAYTEWELNRILSTSKPRIGFVSRRTEELYVKVAKTSKWAMEIIQIDDESITRNVPVLNALLAEAKAVDPHLYEPAHIKDPAKHPLVILCSSGTTGFPKGVALSHRNLLTFLVNGISSSYLDIHEADRLILYLPFYHGYAFGLIMGALATGAMLVLMRSFESDLFLRAVPQYKVTHLTLVPPILVFLAKHPAVEHCDFSSVKEVVCGAAPLPRDLAVEVQKRLKCGPIRNGYGMTELSIITNMSDRSDDSNGDVGRVIPGLLCKVIDQETQEPLNVGQVGEVCFKGDQVMLGYYNNPEATLATIDAEGWLHTGDVGYFDEAERLRIVGRIKELIKYKGYQVSPSEIEMVLLTHPGVKDAAATGKPDEASGELPMAFIVRQPGANVTAKEIVELIRSKLSPQKWLRGGVKFVNDIPKNATGKIMRRELKDMASKL